MPYDENLAARVSRHFVEKKIPFESKRMMGGLVFMVRGKMCVGVETTRMMARLDPGNEAAALARAGCKPMDFTGRPMLGFVFIDATVLRTERQLVSWLKLALASNPKAKVSAKSRVRQKSRA